MTSGTENYTEFDAQDIDQSLQDEHHDSAAQDDGAQDDSQDPLVLAQQEIADLKDKYLRALAEMQNIQRRAKRDVEDANKYGLTSSAKPFLSVADDLNRALSLLPADAPENIRNFAEGIRAVERNLQQALERMGVVAIAAEAGQPLDPHEHEVMFEVDTTDFPHGTIVQILETGYKIHDRLLRPTRVSVAKNSGANNDPAVDVSA